MRLRDPRLWLSLLSLAAVAVVVWIDLRRGTSPGPVHPSHAQVRSLRSSWRGCEDCHGDEATPLAAACNDCHTEIAEQERSGRGLHGSLDAAVLARCGSCHVEHHGAELPLVPDAAFEAAGFPLADFDHGMTDFRLEGAHDALACERCHETARLPSLPEGTKRFLGATQDCAACHEDVHRGRMSSDCASCHGQSQPFEQVAAFVHTERFALVGQHAGQACASCHPAASERSIEAADGGPELPDRGCLDCHDAPHAAPFLAAAATAAGGADSACSDCHPVEGPAFAEAELDRPQHALTGFALDAPHDRASCESCHAPAAPRADPAAAAADWAARFPGRVASDCAACHADPHGGQFAGGALGAACTDCHESTRWTPPRFGAEEHARTAFALTGSHLAADCRACHTDPPPEQPRAFRGTAQRCEACHEDVHRGRFDAELAALPPDPRGSCALCHDTTAFTELRPGAFVHGRWTGFELDGAHLRAECLACHTPPPAPPPPAVPDRRLGFLADRLAAPDDCASCHEDVHAGAFDGAGRPAVIDGRRSCDRCHDSEEFRQLRPDAFDHGFWTAMPLNGAHAQSDCAACHGREPAPDPGRRSLGLATSRFPGLGVACERCHADPHRGAFDGPEDPARVEDREGCARCHQPVSFRSLVLDPFDHGSWTGYPLEGRHAPLSCDACHPPLRRPGPDGREHAFARGTACADCHADPHVGQFRQGAGTDCARCHDSTGFEPARFDHQTQSRFPLDQNHRGLDCAACHQAWPLQGGGEAVRYKPLGTRCQDCHGFGGEGAPR